MSFYDQFDYFDPVTGGVPSHYFSALPQIAIRARALLQGRTRSQLAYVADTIDWLIKDYFESERTEFIAKVLLDDGFGNLKVPKEKRTEAGIQELLDSWAFDVENDAPLLASADNMSEFSALQNCIGRYSIDGDLEFPNAKDYEYFAVLALWQLAECIIWQSKGLVATDHDDPIRELLQAMPVNVALNSPESRFSIAGDCALISMECVCWAEHIKAMAAATANSTEKMQALAESIAREKISVAATSAAFKRHSENHAMKADVFAWCDANMGNYESMDAAAEAIAGQGKVVPVKFRTARDWIGAWNKARQSARTP